MAHKKTEFHSAGADESNMVWVYTCSFLRVIFKSGTTDIDTCRKAEVAMGVAHVICGGARNTRSTLVAQLVGYAAYE